MIKEAICPIDNRQVTGLQLSLPHNWQDILCTAAANGDLDNVLLILIRGGDISGGKSGIDTPLSQAMRNGHLHVARELIKWGAVDGDALYRMACEYQTKNEPRLYLNCLELAAEQGHVDAQLLAGSCCYDGRSGFEKNYRQARVWFEKAVANGNCKAMFRLAHLCAAGLGGGRNLPRAAELLESAAQKEFGRALSVVGHYSLTGELEEIKKNEDKARRYLEKAVKKGCTSALDDYYEVMSKGIGGQANPEAALNYISFHCRRNDSFAQKLMGDICYEKKDVDERACFEARDWYSQSAKQGNKWATFKLAKMYFDGLGGPSDKQQAETLLKKAADQGEPMAQATLARMLLLGEVRMTDGQTVLNLKQHAMTLLEKAANQKCSYAQSFLGEICYYGKFGLKQDSTKAWHWLRKAERSGEPGAVYLLALMHLDSRLPEYNEAVGMIMLHKALKMGVPKAQGSLDALVEKFRKVGNTEKIDASADSTTLVGSSTQPTTGRTDDQTGITVPPSGSSSACASSAERSDVPSMSDNEKTPEIVREKEDKRRHETASVLLSLSTSVDESSPPRKRMREI